jgi:hypothetical protein
VPRDGSFVQSETNSVCRDTAAASVDRVQVRLRASAVGRIDAPA